jgi:TetR/AcrR family transcriptional regulator, tetracycline repressor protein
VPRTATTPTTAKGKDQRIPWGTLSRSQIVDAAMRVVKRGDYRQMTIRSLAAELGASPMSLYRHVRDRDDLLDEVVDRLLARAWRPRQPERDWRAWIAEAADKLRALLVAEPAALHVYVTHPVISPAAIKRMEAMLRVLREAGLAEDPAHRAYATIHTYTVGFAALEASRSGWVPASDDLDDLAHQLANHTTPQQFREGLGYILDAVQQRAGRPRV